MIRISKLFFLNRLHFSKLPELSLSNTTKQYFDSIYETAVTSTGDQWIGYDHSEPKYKFLNYLIEKKAVLVHGTNNSEIREFTPRKQTLANDRDIVNAVFAASDSVWSMYFAIVNRSEYKGSLRNMCITVPTKLGIKRFYFFSINKEVVENRWRDGVIYLFSKSDFEQGGAKNEWICKRPIKPIAKIKVTPEDFPFLDDVRSHDESDTMVKTLFKSLLLNK